MLLTLCFPRAALAESDAYLATGIPDWSQPWTIHELKAAQRALEQMAAVDPGHLPRLRDGSSSALFARISSPANLASCSEDVQPRTRAGDDCVDACTAFQGIASLYVSSRADAEAEELMAIGLQCMAWKIRAAASLAPSPDPSDPKASVRMNGLYGARRTLLLTSVRRLAALDGLAASEVATARRRIGYLRTSFAWVLRTLPEDLRRVLLEEVRKRTMSRQLAHLSADLSSFERGLRQIAASSPPVAPELGSEDFRSLGATLHRQARAQAPVNGWVRVQSTRGHFSIEVPDRFNDYSVRSKLWFEVHQLALAPRTYGCVVCGLPTARFDDAQIEAVACDALLPDVRYLVMEVASSDGKPFDLRAHVHILRQAISAAGGKVVMRDAQLAGRKALELEVKSRDSVGVFRFLAEGNHLYQLAVDYSVYVPNVPADLLSHFFESFRFEQTRAK